MLLILNRCTVLTYWNSKTSVNLHISIETMDNNGFEVIRNN